jgi:ABC-type transporter lipoprotein component MlaA
LRDSVAKFGVDVQASPFRYLADPGARNTVTAVRLTDSRSRLLDREKASKGIALDQYLFVGDAYLQRRQAQVLDGRGAEEQNTDFKGIEPQTMRAIANILKAGNSEKLESFIVLKQ